MANIRHLSLDLYTALVLIVVIMLMGTQPLTFAASSNADTPSAINRGFIEDPPQAWKERFPMCEAYLNVEWIDPDKKIGYSCYETWSEGKKKKIWALVSLDIPGFNYDVYQYWRKGKLKDLFAAVKNGKVFEDNALSIRSKMKRIDFYPIRELVLSNFEKNVCIVYPDQKQAWIVEGKKVGKAYNEKRIDEMYRTIEIFIPGLPMRFFQKVIAVDINFDGIDDYFAEGWLTYSFGDKYLSMKRGVHRHERGYSLYPFVFPPSGKVCTLSSSVWSGYYLITDGKSFSLNNECNLTELTTADHMVKREGKHPSELEISDEARQFMARGIEASKDKNSRSAVDLLDKAIEIAPWWAEANYQRGLALAVVNQYGAAIHDMWRVQAIAGDTPIGRNARDKIEAWQEQLSRLATGQMVKIPAGRFLMGSPDPCDPHCGFCRCAQPQHWVDIKQFEIGKYPVTYDQWESCVEDGGCDRNTWHADRWTGRDLPATSMDWEEMQDYITWVNMKTGKQYRLPSEAEWEYAARAGTTTKFYWGDEIGSGHANCTICGSRWDGKSESPVGSFAPNAFGLYDMAGNVWQWLEDCDNPDYRWAPTDGSAWITGNCRAQVIRGGSWRDKTVGSAYRRTEEIKYGADNVGFRLARTIE